MIRRSTGRPHRKCPKCQLPMWPMELQGVKVDLCTGCQGMWFDRGELEKASGAKLSGAEGSAVAAKGRLTRLICPACSAYLHERSLLRRAEIMVDRCPHCSGLFLDKGEYSAAHKYLRSKAGVLSRRRPKADLPPQLDEDSAGLAIFQYLTGLPLELDVPQKVLSPVVTALILVNVAVLVLAYVYGFDASLKALALVPAEITSKDRLYTLVTSMFMHGGVLHLIGNMYFLFVAGDNVEGRFGWYWFIIFYFACGLAASAAHVIGDPYSLTRAAGASGAISGVMGAYVVLFPRTRFLIRRMIFMLPTKIELPAWVYFGLWGVLQVLYAAMGEPGVAWWAHIGGFGTGALVALAVRLGGCSRNGAGTGRVKRPAR